MKTRIKDLAFSLKIRKEILLSLADSLDRDEKKHYRNWLEPKTDEKGMPRFENGKPLTRPINAPLFKLKYVQKQILTKVLYKNITLPVHFFGGLKKRDAVLNARFHQGNKYFLLTDLKDFYSSINFRQVETALRKEGFYPNVARLITRICTKEGCIPQGCPTSSFLASLVLHHRCKELFQKYKNDGLKVSIYVDDITISGPIDFKPRVQEILSELRFRGMLINFKKTHYCSYNPIVTGIQVKNNGISPLPHTFENLKDKTKSVASRMGNYQRIEYVKRIAKAKFSLS